MIIKIKGIIREEIAKKGIIFLLTFLFLYLILATSLVTEKYNLKEGEIAKVNIKAPREVKDELTTEARIKQAVDAVDLQYSKKSEVKNESLNDINSLLNKAIIIKEGTLDEKEKVNKIKAEAPIKLSEEDFNVLLQLSKQDLKDLQSSLISIMTEVFDGNIMENKQEDIKKAQDTILLRFNSSKFYKSARDLGITIGYSQVKPNLFHDAKKTEELRTEALKKAPPMMIKKDQIIVKESEPVTRHQLEILKDLGLLNENGNFDIFIYISLAVLVAFILMLQWFYLKKYCEAEIFSNISKLVLINLLNCIALVLARTLSIISPYLIPLACIPMLITILIEYKVSLVISVMNCIFISIAAGFNIEITLIAALNAALGAILLKRMQQRNDILYNSLCIGIINAVVTFAVAFLLSNNILQVVNKAGFVFLGSLLAGVLTIGFLPFFENAFDVVTTIKLLELSNPNNPLLKKLLLEAPGTYHHSIMVSNLAEVAAEEVGGNPVLARVSAYYHDIGKIKRPYFFKENQLGTENPHNKITPNLSALIIISHVKDGLELARDYKIPKVIQDVIEQHHGTSLVKYFYITMKNSSAKPEEINEEDFRYGGPIPIGKEVAIIMLADGVEAAVRSISEPTKEKIEEMVNSIVSARLQEGQLDECSLTLKDIDKIKKAFLKVLLGIYHQRIEYPVDKWQEKNEKGSN